MIAFEDNRTLLAWLCVYQDDENLSKWKKSAQYAFGGFALYIYVYSLITSGIFFHQNASEDLALALFAILQIAACFNGVYILLVTFVLRNRVISIINRLQRIYDTYGVEDSRGFLLKACNSNRLMWRIYTEGVVGGDSLGHLLLAFTSYLICRWNYDEFSPEHVYHIFRATLPWDQDTALGYAAEVITQIICSCVTLTSIAIILMFISSCLHHEAFSKMYNEILDKINRQDKNRDDQDVIRKLVIFHVDIKGFFEESSSVYRLFILEQLISSMIIVAGCCLHLDLQIQNMDFEVLTVTLLLLLNLGILFLYCYYGKVATNSYEKIEEYIYFSNWTDLPIHLQKEFIILLRNAQQSIYYHGFGVVLLNLETFTKFMKTVFSYYTIFKTITQ